MTIFSVSLVFTYKIVVGALSKKPLISSSSSARLTASTSCFDCGSDDSDTKASLLSQPTQQLQRRIRKRILLEREHDVDAESLLVLHAAEAAKLRRERMLDAESLAVLIHATAKLDRLKRRQVSSPKTPSTKPPWSSYEKIDHEIPCPSPGRLMSFGGRIEKEEDPFSGPGSDNDFTRSLLEGQRRREESKIWQGSGRAPAKVKETVADLIQRLEALEARDAATGRDISES